MTKPTASITAKPTREAGVFTKRIGHTVYRVGVHFSGTNTETARDKILRLVKTEAEGKAAINQ
jgi:hypothetical protein